jgi:hypothetical protein
MTRRMENVRIQKTLIELWVIFELVRSRETLARETLVNYNQDTSFSKGSGSFHFLNLRYSASSSSFSSLLVQLLCLFLNDHFPLFLFNFCVCFWMIDRESFYFSYLGYDCNKHKSYKNLVFMLIHSGLTFNI